jgi:outer membrane protein assembly factor BamB
MQKYIILLAVLLLSTLYAQNTIWSRHVTGSSGVHIRSIKSIPDVDGDDHPDVIASSENDTLYCLSGTSGTLIWRFVADPCYLERGLIAVPDLDGDSIWDIVLGTVWGTRSVFAISGVNGDTIWQYDTHEYGSGGWVYEVSLMTDMDDDSIVDILASAGGPDATRAYLFSGADGTKIWEYNAGYACFGVREIGDITGDSISDVAVSTGNSTSSAYRVVFLDGTDGSEIRIVMLTSAGWTVVPIGDISGDDVPDVACGLSGGDIHALSGADGSLLWTSSAGGMVVDLNLLPDVDSNGFPELLPSGTGMYNFFCIDAASGSFVWTTPAIDQIFVSVAIPDINGDGINDVVGGTGFTTSYLYALNGSVDSVFWQRNMGSPIESAHWIDDIDGNGIPDILVGTRNGGIYAISDGNVGITETELAEPHFDIMQSSFGRLQITHNLPCGDVMDVSVYSLAGENVACVQVSTDDNPVKIPIPSLPAGVYFAKIDVDQFTAVCKCVILK